MFLVLDIVETTWQEQGRTKEDNILDDKVRTEKLQGRAIR